MDPGGSKTCGSGGSGTLSKLSKFDKKIKYTFLMDNRIQYKDSDQG
jgi:hypothetical protein